MLSAAGTEAEAARPVRLAIDRVFSVKGRGVVVTGSLRGGGLARGASLRLEPIGRTARARELQVHGAQVDAVAGGGRVALNLAGVDADDIARGQVLTDDPTVRPTDRLTAILRPPARLDARESAPAWPPPAGAILRLHLGTDAVEATPGRGRSDAVDLPDGRRVATLRLARPVAAAVGDPFALRVPSPAATAAGGIVIDVAPPIGISRRRTTPEALAALATAWLAGDGSTELAARVRLHGLVARPDAVAASEGGRLVGGWILAEEEAEALDAEAIRLVDAYHGAEPLAAGMPLAGLRRALARSLRRRVTTDERTAGALADGVVDALVASGGLTRSGDVVRDPRRSSGTLPPEVLAAMDRLEAALAVVAPPPFGEAARVARCPAEGRAGPRGVRADRPGRARPRLGRLDVPRARGARRPARRPRPADSGRAARRDRDEPQVRHGPARGPRPAWRPAPDTGRARPRAAGATMSGTPAPTGIVLAGGRSTRFGGDKLTAELDGEPLLWRPIRSLAATGCETIVVAIARDRPTPTLPPDLAVDIRIAHDREPDGGPLVGLQAGLAAAPTGVAIVVAGDQPALRPALLRAMVEARHEPVEPGLPGGRTPLAVVLVDPDGIARPLPCVVDRDAALAAADRLLAGRDTRLRALLRALDAREVPELAWRRHDPDAAWTLDVDEPDDLPPPSPGRPTAGA